MKNSIGRVKAQTNFVLDIRQRTKIETKIKNDLRKRIYEAIKGQYAKN